MVTMCLCAWDLSQAKLGQIRKIKVSIESGEPARPIWAHNSPWAQKVAFMHTMCLQAQAHISARLDQIREFKVSIESEKHARPLWAHNVTQAHKLACMQTIFLHAETKILANFCPISKKKVSMKSQDYFPHVWTCIRSCERARGPKKRPKACHRGQWPPNSPLQELERGVPGCPKIYIIIYIMLVSVRPLVHWSKTN